MKINPAYFALAAKLQEAALAMSHEDIQNRLRDALNDKYRGTGTWAYLVATFGDDKSGTCVYSCDSDLMQADYTCSETGATINTDAAVDVVPLTTYHAEPVGLTEAGRRNSGRDQKQLQAIHDASMSLGASCGVKESARAATSPLKLTESAATTENIVLREARADYEIKLIAPGKGSSAFYPAEVLKRDGPKVFGAGTHVYLNHPTAAQESERPEEDVANLAGVLTTTAEYHESHAKGEGLYARMKVFADHAQLVEEKAQHVGMSIRANGDAVIEGKRPVMRDGVPVLARLTSAESVDVVTRAGAGGMILTEAAKPQTQQEVVMTEAEVTKLVEAAVTKAVASTTDSTAGTIRGLTERAIRGDAREEGARLLESVTLPATGKHRVIETVLRDLPIKDGALDTAKFSELVTAEAKREGIYVAGLTGSGQVRGLGASGAAESDPVKLAEAQKREVDADAQQLKESESVFARLMGDKNAAKAAASKGVAA